jgi:hypothetical protein
VDPDHCHTNAGAAWQLVVLHQFELTEASGALYVLDSGGTTNIENPDRTVTSTPVSASLQDYAASGGPGFGRQRARRLDGVGRNLAVPVRSTLTG